MRLRHIALIVVVAIGLGLVGFYIWLQSSVNLPGPLAQTSLIYITPGSGTKKISATLFQAGAIDSPFVFAYGAKSMGGNLKFGEYQVPAHASMASIILLLQSGRTYQRHVTIPEGLTSAEIVGILNDAEALEGKIDVIPAEGSLLPQTYNYSRGDKRSAIIDRMTKDMNATLKSLWANHAPNILVKSPQEAVTLASIVEKETALPVERPRIAGVFYNRLKMGMPLQSDPTVIYAITQGKTKLGRPLTRADLEYASPYNTYLNAGLPPGPIANPGRASIEAVLNPEQNSYFYFVADGSGGHAFAKTLSEHQQNVAKWREVEKQGK